MGDNGISQKGDLPPWFVEYVRGQRQQQQEAEQAARQREEALRQQLREEEQKKVTNGNKPGKSLPPLQDYYGDSDKLESWLHQARVKIRVDYDECTEFVKFWALAGSLKKRALTRMDAWTRQYGTPDQAKAETFFTRMKFVFYDPQAKERAVRKLGSLRQGNRPFLEVYMDWQGLLIEVGGADWPDTAKKISLDSILSDELARAMITVPTPDSFEAYCNTLKGVDDRLRAYKTRQGRSFKGHSEPTTSEKQNVEEPEKKDEKPTEEMDWQPTPKVAAGGVRRAKWVDNEEMNRRRQNRLCIRCGDRKHMIRNCPYLGPLPPKQAVSAAMLDGPKLEDENEESEKE
jgi:hypothetical protein